MHGIARYCQVSSHVSLGHRQVVGLLSEELHSRRQAAQRLVP